MTKCTRCRRWPVPANETLCEACFEADLNAAPAGPESPSVPQDAKSNPSNGLVERLREATDGATELQDQHGSVVGYDCHLGNIGDLCDEAADEIERLQRAQQAGVLSSQRAWVAAFMTLGRPQPPCKAFFDLHPDDVVLEHSGVRICAGDVRELQAFLLVHGAQRTDRLAATMAGFSEENPQ